MVVSYGSGDSLQVQDWLKEVFAAEEVPAYEINSQTVAVLHHLATRSQKRAKLAKMTIEDLEQKTREYLAESERLESENKWLGLNTEDLPPASKNHLQTLAATALALNLCDCSETRYKYSAI